MGVQEQAFRSYYASMTDGQLLATAANRSSFIEVAQRMLDEELARRKLSVAAGTPQRVEGAAAGAGSVVHRLFHRRSRVS